jgi:hypothetical protein
MVALLPGLGAHAASLGDAFAARSLETRVTLQRRLAKADLYFGEIDGRWNDSTERALRRGADQIALSSAGEIHPDLRRTSSLENYLSNLEVGAFDKLLKPRKSGWFGD